MWELPLHRRRGLRGVLRDRDQASTGPERMSQRKNLPSSGLNVVAHPFRIPEDAPLEEAFLVQQSMTASSSSSDGQDEGGRRSCSQGRRGAAMVPQVKMLDARAGRSRAKREVWSPCAASALPTPDQTPRFNGTATFSFVSRTDHPC
jgi:hypothetical protein